MSEEHPVQTTHRPMAEAAIIWFVALVTFTFAGSFVGAPIWGAMVGSIVGFVLYEYRDYRRSEGQS